MTKTLFRFLGVAAVVAVSMTGARKAHATSTTYTCTQVQDVYWGNGGQFFIDCVGQSIRFFNNNTCAAVPATIDDRKTWDSLATSALLSGKSLSITYDAGSGSSLLCPTVQGTIGAVQLNH
ncbi:MAG TPA: hypothetical protein VN962_15010 [Polyangia bacterium]|nr:hypothetical protein [Polyangia bacterium]